jgi:hypothetical protein
MDEGVKRKCDFCKQSFRPRVPDQRFCGAWCRQQGKAKEGRDARRAWWSLDRPEYEEQKEAS